MGAAKQTVLIGVALAVAAGLAIKWWSGKESTGPHVAVTVPDLSALARHGARAFARNCTACHGDNAAGSDQGPPLIHKIYEPGHHGDGAIVRAITQGVRGHHWPFGNMPRQPQVTRDETRAIIAYLREVQRANGIH